MNEPDDLLAKSIHAKSEQEAQDAVQWIRSTAEEETTGLRTEAAELRGGLRDTAADELEQLEAAAEQRNETLEATTRESIDQLMQVEDDAAASIEHQGDRATRTATRHRPRIGGPAGLGSHRGGA